LSIISINSSDFYSFCPPPVHFTTSLVLVGQANGPYLEEHRVLEDLALYCRTNTTSKKQNVGNERTIKSVVLTGIWIHPDYTPRHNLLSVAELKRICNAFEIKAPRQTLERFTGFSGHFSSYSYSR